MEKWKIETKDAPQAIGPYSQGISARPGTVIFVSGQLGLDPATGVLVGETVKAQTEQALRNLLAIIRARGGSEDSIVKTTVYLRRLEDFAAMNETYSKLLQAPYPARSCIGGCDLPKQGLVEIEAIAVLEV